MGLLNAGGAPAVPMTLATLPPFVPKKPRTATHTHTHTRAPCLCQAFLTSFGRSPAPDTTQPRLCSF